MYLSLDELIEEIRNIFYLSYKEKCDKCKYQLFSKKLQNINVSSDVLKIVLKEIKEDKEYNKKKWTKIFKPAMTYVGSATLSSYISDWIFNQLTETENVNFWLGLFFLSVVFFALYFIFGSIIASIIIFIDAKRNKSEQLIRFLEKYVNNIEFEKNTKTE